MIVFWRDKNFVTIRSSFNLFQKQKKGRGIFSTSANVHTSAPLRNQHFSKKKKRFEKSAIFEKSQPKVVDLNKFGFTYKDWCKVKPRTTEILTNLPRRATTLPYPVFQTAAGGRRPAPRRPPAPRRRPARPRRGAGLWIARASAAPQRRRSRSSARGRAPCCDGRDSWRSPWSTSTVSNGLSRR